MWFSYFALAFSLFAAIVNCCSAHPYTNKWMMYLYFKYIHRGEFAADKEDIEELRPEKLRYFWSKKRKDRGDK